MIYDLEDVLTVNKEKILEGCLDYASSVCDGVCQMNVDTGDLLFCSMFPNEVENPANRVVEVYRIEAGLDKESACQCIICDEGDGEGHCCDSVVLDECLMTGLFEDFDCEFDDIVDGILCQIEENGYDLI